MNGKSSEVRLNRIVKMADTPINLCASRKMSFGINGKLNGVEVFSKTPFLIGVSGGTASGKVNYVYSRQYTNI